MKFPRASGILLHPTSLPGPFGIGDLGPAAFRFVEFLESAGQTYWQMLPLNPTGYGDSPYSSFSAFAGNTTLISPEKLVVEGFIPEDLIKQRPDFPRERVDYGGAIGWKKSALWAAFEAFQPGEEFNAFCDDNAWWLDDYSLFHVLREKHGYSSWTDWPDPLKHREAGALGFARDENSRQIDAEKFFQFLFYKQLRELKQHANERGVKLIGDIPIFVSHDSADVWCNQSIFKLNDDGSPKFVSGTPPDFFSSTGQKWGSPLYDWDALRKSNFEWWNTRLAWSLQNTDVVRLDHFIGFVRTWEIPAEDDTAENGQWVDVPGRELFEILKQRLGDTPLIAEDLGAMTSEVEAVRDEFGFPGMRILQYGFGGDANNNFLPHNYVRNCVAYTGTHDNDTTAGWYASAQRNVKKHCREYLASSSRDVCGEMVRACLASIADIAIIPLQDIFNLGTEARMNTPGGQGSNWGWRFTDEMLTEERVSHLRKMTELYGRRPA